MKKIRIQRIILLKKISFCFGCLFIALGLPFCCIGALCPSDPLLCNQLNIIWILIGSLFLLVSLILYLIVLFKKRLKNKC